jgi:hypothetical protein
MEVSMDGLRWQLLGSYNSLVRKLNQSIIKHDSFESEIEMNPDEIQQELDVMRSCIVTLSYMYMEGKFEVLENPKFETFNEQEDED